MGLEEKLKIYNQTKLEAKGSFIRIGPFGQRKKQFRPKATAQRPSVAGGQSPGFK